MLLAEMNTSLLASGGIWILFFLIIFKTLRNKANGGATAVAIAKSEANSAASGGNADVGGISIHLHVASVNGGNGELIPTTTDYVLPANDPVVAQLMSKLLPHELNSVDETAIQSESKIDTYDMVEFS